MAEARLRAVFTLDDSNFINGIDRDNRKLTQLGIAAEATNRRLASSAKDAASSYNAVDAARARMAARGQQLSTALAASAPAPGALLQKQAGLTQPFTPGAQWAADDKIMEARRLQNQVAAELDAQKKGKDGEGGGLGGLSVVAASVAAGTLHAVTALRDAGEATDAFKFKYAQLQQQTATALVYAGLAELPSIAAGASEELQKINIELNEVARQAQRRFVTPQEMLGQAGAALGFGETFDEKTARLAEQTANARNDIAAALQKQAELGRDELRVVQLRVEGRIEEAEALQDQLELANAIKRINAMGSQTGAVEATTELKAQAAAMIQGRRETENVKKMKAAVAARKESEEALRMSGMTPGEQLAESKAQQARDIEAMSSGEVTGIKAQQLGKRIAERQMEINKTEKDEAQQQSERDAHMEAMDRLAEEEQAVRDAHMAAMDLIVEKEQAERDAHMARMDLLVAENAAQTKRDTHMKAMDLVVEKQQEAKDLAEVTASVGLLSQSERRGFRNTAAASLTGDKRTKALRALGFSATEVASGDALRRKEFEKAEARKKAGKLTEGEALNSIAKNTAATAKVIGRAFSEPVEVE